jgi:hypothetical protein
MKMSVVVTALFVTALLLLGINHAIAQVEVSKGSTHKYSVTPIPESATYDYHWSVTPGGTTSGFGTGATSNDIVWDGAVGNYTITVYPTRPISNCTGNNITLSIAVVDMNITWNTNSSSQCPKTDNQTGDFYLTVNYTGVSGAWSFNYSIDGATPQTVNVPAGTSIDVLISGFTNDSNSVPASHTIRITSVATADNYKVNFTGAETDAASHIHTVIVEPAPNTSEIIQL